MPPPSTRDHRSPGRAGAAPEPAEVWSPPGRAGFDIVPPPTSRLLARTAQCHTGQPSRSSVPVRLSPQRSRPPALHRRGRSPCPSLPRDHADGATLGRLRRTRRPGFRDAETGCVTASEHTGNTAHRGVPGTPLCRNYLPATRNDPHNGAAGQPSRQTVPVHLLQFGRRPPAHHRRGRSPFPSPQRDHADGATLGRRRRTRRPGFLEAR